MLHMLLLQHCWLVSPGDTNWIRQMDVAMKYGQQSALGFNGNTTVPTLELLDGRLCIVNEIGYKLYSYINILFVNIYFLLIL